MEQNTLNDVLNFIRTYLEENNQLSPTVREIAKGCFISDGHVRRCLDLLQARSKITRLPQKARSIRLTTP
jgi:MarR-like DNA-binding transcriptional regulator SgrR of sgrS sRNA